MDQKGSLSDQEGQILSEVSLKEKVSFCSGKDFWHLNSLDRLGLPASVPAICFPTGSALASSWNIELIYEIGVALGKECVNENVSVLLGPSMNIKRHAFCGRNFEVQSFSGAFFMIVQIERMQVLDDCLVFIT